ncbi:MAG: CAP domain-containing protein [Burkholderiales bacterium]
MLPPVTPQLLAAVAIHALAIGVTAAANLAYAQRLATLVNEYRASHRLSPLTVDTTVAALAREHSAAMAKADKLSHDGFPSRVKRSGLPMCVENVGWNYGTAERQFEGWRTSPGHDRNMLDPRVERIGIGTEAAYVTMIACGK